jgi:hypothetical protein
MYDVCRHGDIHLPGLDTDQRQLQLWNGLPQSGHIASPTFKVHSKIKKPPTSHFPR